MLGTHGVHVMQILLLQHLDVQSKHGRKIALYSVRYLCPVPRLLEGGIFAY
jgi:hypothetical protein